MSLSGGLLNPLIYGAVLQALGISPADLTSPAAAQAAFAGAIARNGDPFDVPGIPRASGYATAYFSANFNSPIVLLAGFELDRTHLGEEAVDYGDPAVTARDVVDRTTLKAFVTQAGEYFVKIQESGDLTASQQARIALRDPNGPWRHGSVYLGVMDPDSRVILFHGAFPDRFELRRGGISRDVVTGELIVNQLIASANSSPEGGFWQYHFDNPADDSDSAEIPKVGYARIFTGNLPTPGGGTRPTRFIVNSGFYLSTPEVSAARRNAVVESVLPQVMRAMTAGTVDAVSARIEQATSGRAPDRAFSIAGASTFSGAVLANGWALESDAFDPGRLLAGSSFTLPLAAAGSGQRGERPVRQPHAVGQRGLAPLLRRHRANPGLRRRRGERQPRNRYQAGREPADGDVGDAGAGNGGLHGLLCAEGRARDDPDQHQPLPRLALARRDEPVGHRRPWLGRARGRR